MDKPPGHLKPYRRNQKNIPLITLITLISGDKKKTAKISNQDHQRRPIFDGCIKLPRHYRKEFR
jgi:hypothetical protein